MSTQHTPGPDLSALDEAHKANQRKAARKHAKSASDRLLHDTLANGDGRLYLDGQVGRPVIVRMPDELAREVARRYNSHADLLAALENLVHAAESAFLVLDARVAADIRNRDRFTTECLRAAYGRARLMLTPASLAAKGAS